MQFFFSALIKESEFHKYRIFHAGGGIRYKNTEASHSAFQNHIPRN
jgi:hypothetical protein